MAIYRDFTELIGNTPLLELSRLGAALGWGARVLGKLERQNPAGSVKDRAALYMIQNAERSGKLSAGGTIIEPTSGNTGVGLAAIAAVRGYRTILTMPDTMSSERRSLLKALGAEVVLTSGSLGMAGAVAKAEELRREIPGSVLMGQFDNPANAMAHEETTGPEILRDTGGEVDVFVAGVGSGGTVSGTGRYLRREKPDVEIIAVQPENSPVLTGGEAAPHKIEGIGANFVPENYDSTAVSRVLSVGDEEAREMARLLAMREGILGGVSSGAALAAAGQLALLPEYEGKTIVVLLPDTGERYLSTGLFEA